MLRDATLNILSLKTNSHHTDKRQTTDKQVGTKALVFFLSFIKGILRVQYKLSSIDNIYGIISTTIYKNKQNKKNFKVNGANP